MVNLEKAESGVWSGVLGMLRTIHHLWETERTCQGGLCIGPTVRAVRISRLLPSSGNETECPAGKKKKHTQKWRRLENTLLSRAVVLRFQPVSSPGGLVHTGSWALPWSFSFSRCGVELRICISDKHSGDTAAAASGTTHWELPLQSPVCPEVVSGLIASVSPGSLLGCRVSGPAPDLRPLFLPLSFCDFGPDHLPKPPFQRSLITGSTSYDCFVSLMCRKLLENCGHIFS